MSYRYVHVKSYNRIEDGHREHVRSYRRRARRSEEELTPEDPHEVEERIHVKGHESESKTGKIEHVRPYNYERKEERFNGGSKELYRKVYREYREKGYSKKRAKEIAGGVVGEVYRRKLAEAR